VERIMTEQLQESTHAGTLLQQNVPFAEFVKRYEGKSAEWDAGDVYTLMSNNEKHQAILTLLVMILGLYLSFRRIGRLYTDGYSMYISDHQPARQPDVLVVLAEHYDRIQPQYLNGAADLVVEILSPATGLVDRGAKYYEYQDAGVREYWLIDPISKQIDVYALNEEGLYQRVYEATNQIVSRLLPGFVLDAGLLWGDELPQGAELIQLVQEMTR
jgi:Uma2 family endonuclease